ncbi:unnamed protein product [Urochloa humidicola]
MFGSKNDASRLPNLIPAVDAAYWLGVAQGAVLLYWQLCYCGHTSIVKDVTTRLGLESESATVRRYWHETAAGCEKDLAFSAGRNLMTYAVELLQSKSPDKFLSGIRILGTVIRQGLLPCGEELPKELSRKDIRGRLVLIKQLLTGLESFGHLIEELLKMLGPRSPYCLKIRRHAASIVLLVAHEIYLEEHPRCIQSLSSLLDACEEHENPYLRRRELRDTPYERSYCLEEYELDWLVETYIEESPHEFHESREWDLQAPGYIYMDMVRLGLSILKKLAADEHNCNVMCSTDGLLPRIMAPLCCRMLNLHSVDHKAWEYIIAATSLDVMDRLVRTTGEAGKALRSTIGNEDTIRTMEGILQRWPRRTHEITTDVVTLLCTDASLGMQERAKGFIQFLLNIFADGNCKYSIRIFAGRKLRLLSSQRADIILKLDGILVSLKDIFQSHPRSTLGLIAVEIMDDLCGGNYTDDGECHSNMKNAMTAVMPQVLTELFGCDGSTEEATPTEIEEATPTGTEGAVSISIPPEDEGSQTTLQSDSSLSHQRNREAEKIDITEWQIALLPLSTKFFDKYASHDDQILPSLLNEVVPKLTKMADAKMQPTDYNLEIMKLITKLVISLVGNGYVTEGMDILMASLTRASNEMMDFDGPVLCSPGVEDGATNRTLSTLCSLVEEAQKLVDSRNAQEGSMVQDSSGGNN